MENVQRMSDQGTYMCTTRNKHNFTSHKTVEVNVLVPPKITPFTFARDLNVGDRTSVQCVVTTGDLPLNFTWLRDDMVIVQSPIHDTYLDHIIDESITIRQNDDFTSALSITSVTQLQGGSYSCRVKNDAATVSHTSQLRVNVPPRISPFNFESDITEGMRTQLMCSSSQGDQPFNITWFRGTQPISQLNDATININAYSPFSSILTIHNVSSRHNGNYTCQISNLAGITEYTNMLSVAVPPRWINEPQDVNVIVGSSIIISCQADGFPQPKVIWKQAIDEQNSEYSEFSYQIGANTNGIDVFANGTLTIHKIAKDHKGYLLCQANNGIGAGLSKLVFLNVHVGPSVTVRSKEITIRRGERVTLQCQADGDQPLDITWRTKNNRIDSTYDIRYNQKTTSLSSSIISELSITQSILSDRGEYSCLATNAFGHDHGIIHLLVQEPPTFPRNLHVTELSSRSIFLGWSAPGTEQLSVDAQPITNYVLQYKEAHDVWHDHNTQKMIQGDKTATLVQSLKPATNYHFRMYAENHLGTSAPSDILHIKTDGEVPTGPPKKISVEPTGSEQLLVTWLPPERDQWNGELKGYKIGYHQLDDDDQTFNYTSTGTSGGEIEHDFRLTDLRKYTKYRIIVKSFNEEGDGPESEPVIAQTLEDVPSAPPQYITCMALTAQNIQISWQAPPKESTHGNIQGYKIMYEPVNIEFDYVGREMKLTATVSYVLHGLQPYTNYTIQILAYTRAGDGIASQAISCTTEEAVPDAPERIKSLVNSDTSVIISWLPPKRPNGIITKYTVFIRVLDKGQEVKIVKDILLAHNHHYQANNLNAQESYEAWITASTRIGQGPSTPVIKLQPNSVIPAAIISFGQTLSVAWCIDIKLSCIFVGQPKPVINWRFGDIKVSSTAIAKQNRLEIDSENTLTLQNVQRNHQGNYTCQVKNYIGSDMIVYQILVQVPPSAPNLKSVSSNSNSVSVNWNNVDTGGSALRGYTLSYSCIQNDWNTIMIDRHATSYQIEKLKCGTQYNFQLTAYNKIGNGNPSNIEVVWTKGNKPISPNKQHLIRANITSVLLELISWQDGGCPILYFSIEYKRFSLSNEYIVVSSHIAPQPRFVIGDLEPGTKYNIRMTAHNNAGATVSEYYFHTLSIDSIIKSSEKSIEILEIQNNTSILFKSSFVAVSVAFICVFLLALIGLYFCYQNNILNSRNFSNSNHNINLEDKLAGLNDHAREQFYATSRKKSCSTKSCNDGSGPSEGISGLDRIPEYSEDIYPYATFHLPEHENMAGNPAISALSHHSEINSVTNSKCHYDSNLKQIVHSTLNTIVNSSISSLGGSGTPRRSRNKSKNSKSESEEYDSLGSDTDTPYSGTNNGADRKKHHSDINSENEITFTESLAAENHLPISSGQRKKEKLTLIHTRSTHHIHVGRKRGAQEQNNETECQYWTRYGQITRPPSYLRNYVSD